MSEDIHHRQVRYLITMSVRTACFAIAAVLGLALHGGLRWLALVPVVGAVILPYVAVIVANGGREPDSASRFRPYDPKSSDQNQISGPSDEIHT